MNDKRVLIVNNFKPPTSPGVHYRLLCMTGKYKGTSYYLKTNRAMIGRSDDADIQILDTKGSREHAELVKMNDTFVLTDLNSQNGIIVNDLKITQYTLRDNDKIIIGQTVFKFNLFNINEKDQNEIIESDDFKNEDKEFEQAVESGNSQKNKKMNLRTLLIGAGVFLLIMLMFDEEPTIKSDNNSRNAIFANSAERSDQLTSALAKKQRSENKEVEKRLRTIISRGQRELRERNYFRAIAEFHLAKTLRNDDEEANRYLSIAKNELNRIITEDLLRGERELDSLKFEGAKISFCNVIRLLEKYPNNDNYKTAISKLEYLEQKLEIEKGEIKCF